jgi:dipeptidyl aminopeptidase/acylaminoacyl peptidase
MRRVRLGLVSVLASAALACEAAQLGWPPVPLRVPSPDGRVVAFVRNHPDVDPPNQSLWLQASNGVATELTRLAPDADSCNVIVWSADSRRVAFLISDAVVQIYDGQSHAKVFSGFVGRRSWDTPPRYILQDMGLSPDGTSVTFRECERTWQSNPPERQNARGTRVEPMIGGCSGVTTVALADVPSTNFR